jgi:thymidylate synthase ThyX
MPQNRQVYLLDPQNLTPETIAVTFAKTSRSPQTFREIAAELNQEKSSEFHEKWVVGYGHSSVAEHAVLHIAVENISRLAVECLESNRLASYTEKSTRYQKWDCDSFYIPEELTDPILRQIYIETNQNLFLTYQKSLPIIQAEISKTHPRRSEESDAAWERRLRSHYVDVSRFLLPASALANVGVTINARALEHALRKMLTHPLAEVRRTGEEIKAVSLENVPTLVKYANPVPHWQQVETLFKQQGTDLPPADPADDWCQLVDHDPNAELRVIAALLYRTGESSYDRIWAYLQTCSEEQVSEMAQQVMADISKFDIPMRELEYATYTFDLVMDQGAYFEIKRHRMMTQTPQKLTTLLGYALPKTIVDAGFEQEYHQAMRAAHQAYLRLAEFDPQIAAYIVPNGYNRRLLLRANTRSLEHLIALRSAPNAHFSVRRLAHRMASEIIQVSPLGKFWIHDSIDENWQQVEESYFTCTNCQP